MTLGADPDQQLLDRLEADLADVERALERLDEGSYTSCEVCGAQITAARLARAPATRRCDGHDPGAEQHGAADSVSEPPPAPGLPAS